VTHFPIVFEREASGAISAYVPGLPVYAVGDTHRKAEQAIGSLLTAYLKAHPDSRPDVQVRVARVTERTSTRVDIIGVAALVGAQRTASKARASRANGRLGGRPRKATTTERRAKSAR
jgi:predicted RNase H-like HicB family nuclease